MFKRAGTLVDVKPHTSPSPADGTPWLTDPQQREWRALLAMLATLPVAIDGQLKRDAGVNGYEYQVLAALSESRDHTSVLSDLAETARCSLSRLSHALTRLEKAGWVERFSAADEAGRRMRARLTDDGLAKMEAIAPGHVREARRLVIDVLTPEQLSALGEAARLVTSAALDGAPEDCRHDRGC